MGEPAEPAPSEPAARGGRRLQVLLAVLSLIGVLGAALIEHWHELFVRAPALEGAAAGHPDGGGSSGAQSPVVHDVNGNVTINIQNQSASSASGAGAGALRGVGADGQQPSGAELPADGPPLALQELLGDWESDPFRGAYDHRSYVLRLHLENIAGEIAGTVVELLDGRADPALDLYQIRSSGGVVSFETHSLWCCNDQDKEQPYQDLYNLRRGAGGIAVSRHNTIPTGGSIERFVLHRAAGWSVPASQARH